MASTNLKFLDASGNEVTKQAEVTCAFNKNGIDSIVLEFGEVEGENNVVQVLYNVNDTYQAIPDSQEKDSNWMKIKGILVDILNNRLSVEEYKNVPEEIHAAVTREDQKIGHPLALREANYRSIKANYTNALAFLNAPKAETISSEIPQMEESVVGSENIPIIEPIPAQESSIINDAPIFDTQINATGNNNEEIKNESIDVNNLIYKEMSTPEVAKVGESVVPDIESMSITSSDESQSKIMEAIQTPDGMLSEVQDLPPIVDNISEQSKIVDSSENVVSESVQESIVGENKEENSAVKDSYLSKIELLEQKATEAKENFIREINTSHEVYINELKEIEREIAENLTQSKMIRDSAEQTLRKAEEYQASNVVQMPIIEEEQQQILSKVA